MPSKLAQKISPLSELQNIAQINDTLLTSKLEKFGANLPQLAFHGAREQRAIAIESFLSDKAGGFPLFLATTKELAVNPKDRLSDLATCFQKANSYALGQNAKLYFFDASDAKFNMMVDIKNRASIVPPPFGKPTYAGELAWKLDNRLRCLGSFGSNDLAPYQIPTHTPDYFDRIKLLEPLHVQNLLGKVFATIE